jgi:UDP-N-acetylmuramate dehydrogenase
MKIGGATFSKKHANFLINQKKSTATDIRRLADKARESVKEKYGLELEEEIEYIGKW